MEDDDPEALRAAELHQQQLAGLMQERSYYEFRDEPDNIAAVDAYLVALGEPAPGGQASTTRTRKLTAPLPDPASTS